MLFWGNENKKKENINDVRGGVRQIHLHRRGNSCCVTVCNATSLRIKEPVDARWRYSFNFILLSMARCFQAS